MLALPNQTPGLKEQYGLTREQVDREVWAVDQVGHRYAGAAAINYTLSQLGEFWAAVGRFYLFPPVSWVEDRVYRWIAEHRGQLSRWWSATPECEQPGILCE